jgi:hypothetical protein
MIIPSRAESKIDALTTNGTNQELVSYSCDLSAALPVFSKFFSAPLKGTGTRNIPRHLVMILPNIGSLRL